MIEIESMVPVLHEAAMVQALASRSVLVLVHATAADFTVVEGPEGDEVASTTVWVYRVLVHEQPICVHGCWV